MITPFPSHNDAKHVTTAKRDTQGGVAGLSVRSSYSITSAADTQEDVLGGRVFGNAVKLSPSDGFLRITSIGVKVGSSTGGTLIVGVYLAVAGAWLNGILIGKSAATTLTATSAVQTIPLAAEVLISPNTQYFLACVSPDSVTIRDNLDNTAGFSAAGQTDLPGVMIALGTATGAIALSSQAVKMVI
jgi:hypothetical protein